MHKVPKEVPFLISSVDVGPIAYVDDSARLYHCIDTLTFGEIAKRIREATYSTVHQYHLSGRLSNYIKFCLEDVPIFTWEFENDRLEIGKAVYDNLPNLASYEIISHLEVLKFDIDEAKSGKFLEYS